MKRYVKTGPKGSGKTIWLLDRIADAKSAGLEVYYFGSSVGYIDFRKKCWDAGITGLRFMHDAIPEAGFVIVTDGLHEAMQGDPQDLAFAERFAEAWYLAVGVAEGTDCA